MTNDFEYHQQQQKHSALWSYTYLWLSEQLISLDIFFCTLLSQCIFAQLSVTLKTIFDYCDYIYIQILQMMKILWTIKILGIFLISFYKGHKKLDHHQQTKIGCMLELNNL